MNQTLKQNSTGSINYQWAFSLIHYFTLQGVTQAVISPGSRSTALALACEQHPKISTWVQIDERSAGFFALGLAQHKHQPVILICTSGSAVANWFPAVAEANHSYTPLLLLSADRPEELQDCGANQTIDQRFLFGTHVRDFIALEHADETLLKSNYLKRITTQAYTKALTQKPGPVHLNIPFREPLLPRRFTADELNHFIQRLGHQAMASATALFKTNIQSSITAASISKNSLNSLIQTLETGDGLIICGRLNQHEQNNFTHLLALLTDKLNCPVLIDPLSNQRFSTVQHSHFIYNYDHFLKHKVKQDLKQSHVHAGGNNISPKWIIRFGQFPVSKTLLHYLQSLESHTILVSSYGDCLDPVHKANTVLHISPEKLCTQLLNSTIKNCSDDWIDHWQQIEQQSEDKIKQSIEPAENSNTLFEGHVISSMLRHIPDNSLLFSGNSMAIRDFDTFITHSSIYDKKLNFFANRGTSGIDGNLSTFFGLLANQDGYGVALLGDLSFYHDMNGLLICKQLAAQGLSASIIVINNNGGGIFNYLPQRQLNDFDKLFKTEINLDFQHSARLYDLNYHKISSQTELKICLPEVFKLPGIQLVEIIIDQQISVECHRQI